MYLQNMGREQEAVGAREPSWLHCSFPTPFLLFLASTPSSDSLVMAPSSIFKASKVVRLSVLFSHHHMSFSDPLLPPSASALGPPKLCLALAGSTQRCSLPSTINDNGGIYVAIYSSPLCARHLAKCGPKRSYSIFITTL